MESKPKKQKTQWELDVEQRQKNVNDEYDQLAIDAKKRFNEQQYKERQKLKPENVELDLIQTLFGSETA